uniref:Armadillo/beta-catenin repeat family protein n=1 Tax=Arundo donax TaxID=35708 RepID=A0A0A9FMF7_ARUDO
MLINVLLNTAGLLSELQLHVESIDMANGDNGNTWRHALLVSN